MDLIPTFDDWVADADPTLSADPIWRMKAYRMAMYLLDIAWNDAVRLDRVRITRPIAAQLYRAVGSIGADIGEGYSRSSGLDRVRFFEYGLGSTRESAVWYRAGLRVLGKPTHDRRVDLLSQIRRMVLTAIPAERVRRIRPER